MGILGVSVAISYLSSEIAIGVHQHLHGVPVVPTPLPMKFAPRVAIDDAKRISAHPAPLQKGYFGCSTRTCLLALRSLLCLSSSLLCH